MTQIFANVIALGSPSAVFGSLFCFVEWVNFSFCPSWITIANEYCTKRTLLSLEGIGRANICSAVTKRPY